MECVICRIDVRQELENDGSGYSAVCGDCGPYKIDSAVMLFIDQGRRLHAGLTKAWIAENYDAHSNPIPLITIQNAKWAS